MKKIFNSHHPVRHLKSVKYAFQGIFHAMANEANFRIQLIIVSICTVLGFYYKIQPAEWSIIVLSMGVLLAAEMINTVIEEFIDHLIHEHHEGARVIKDLSAGFVLVIAFTSLIIISIIFGHRIFPAIF